MSIGMPPGSPGSSDRAVEQSLFVDVMSWDRSHMPWTRAQRVGNAFHQLALL